MANMSEFDYMEYVGMKIRKLREQRGMTQADLVAACDLPEQSIKRIEAKGSKTKAKGIDAMTLFKIAEYFDVDMKYLLEPDNNIPKQIKADASQVTGLSYNAVSLLSSWKNSNDKRKKWSEFVSRIIVDKDCETLLGNMSDIIGHAKVVSKTNNVDIVDKDNYAASLWYITHTFTNIIERLFIGFLDSYLQNEYHKGSE